jgi:hypothetical protein
MSVGDLSAEALRFGNSESLPEFRFQSATFDPFRGYLPTVFLTKVADTYVVRMIQGGQRRGFTLNTVDEAAGDYMLLEHAHRDIAL